MKKNEYYPNSIFYSYNAEEILQFDFINKASQVFLIKIG